MHVITTLDEIWLQRHPLPRLDPDGDKESRGHVLVVSGSCEIPGAALLAATAALRAGAGKLTVATVAPIAPHLALALPEARVVGLPLTPSGEWALNELGQLMDSVGDIDALLVGPGMQPEAATQALASALLAVTSCPVVLDAYAMGAVLAGRLPRAVITPHAGELAHLTGLAKEAILSAPCDTAHCAATQWQTQVLLKGATTWFAEPDGARWRHGGGNAGLGVSGSGDVLAGAIAGLLARGLPIREAAAWGVALHGRAGDQLANRLGPLGYLAREIADTLPVVMAKYG
ncbi:NAD(P)H-hydrate dehydratase [Chitinolyticbacter albus]|uniref:NAD(P)H-hydrate dehydratase n=1 Tax=Chitinolyticbacter albus TaxID=2961951 RepID=UPI00210A305E|nr:NAD(P)H-hydrate dehydratase [Chitinolyticbacter albus]